MHNMSKKITMKKVIIPVVVLAGISAVLLAFVRPFEKKSSSLTLETKDVIRGDISEVITSTGTLEALETVEVGTQVSGISPSWNRARHPWKVPRRKPIIRRPTTSATRHWPNRI
jgi:multidrug efflux pump subunit AcrA (membrane-fusion protein)